MQPDPITLRIPTGRRVIVPEVVLMQPRLSIEDLTREVQVVGLFRLTKDPSHHKQIIPIAKIPMNTMSARMPVHGQCRRLSKVHGGCGTMGLQCVVFVNSDVNLEHYARGHLRI